ncbi:Ig-like domain repeat protein, partial [Streptomyces sp. NPDC058741]|uniref:Ig-like domain repeat protein n=1 Tax=Streptomyces sp. NPDC058741 TaxID=3346620 RepID=UPI0036B48567
VCGQPVTVCATVTPVAPGNGTPTGTLTLTGPAGLDQTTDLAPDGTTCITTTMLETGLVTATYNGDGCFTPSTGTAPVTVDQAASTTTVTVDPVLSVCGQTVTVCATVAPASPGSEAPTGTVTFTGPGLDQTVDLAPDGTACVTADNLTTGTVTATYNGDTCFTPSTGTATVTIEPAVSAVSVTVNPNPSVCGQPVTVCAAVTAAAPGSGTPGGTVTFTGAGLNQTVDLAPDGTACVTAGNLTTGTVTVTYNGDTCFTPSTGTASLTVNRAASSATVSVNPNPSVCGQSVTVCATVMAVAPGNGTPTGTVTFTGPGGLALTAPLGAQGTACVTAGSLTTGTVTATYNGDTCFTPSTGTAPVTVNNAQTTTVLTVTRNPQCGQPVTLCAKVTTVAPGSGTPTGSVTFNGPGGFTQTVPLDAQGTACVTTTASTSGTVTAVYGGNSCSSPSAATASLTVTAAPTTLTAAPAQLRLRTNGTFVIPSLSATLKVTSTSAPVAGHVVVFSANTAMGPVLLGTALTNASGVATLAPPPLTVPSMMITAASYTASFSGSSCYGPSSVTAPLNLVLFPLLP